MMARALVLLCLVFGIAPAGAGETRIAGDFRHAEAAPVAAIEDDDADLAVGAKPTTAPSATAPVPVAPAGGDARPVWLGVRIKAVETTGGGLAVPKDTKGAVVVQVEVGGPAATADIKAGDVVVAVDGEAVETMKDLPRIVSAKPAGTTVALDLLREGARRTTFVTLGYREAAAQPAAAREVSPEPARPAPEVPARPVLGLTLAKLTDELRSRYRVDDHLNGVVVTGVEPKSPAARQRIKPGHVIVAVAGGPVEAPADVVRAYETDIAKGGSVTLLLMSSTTQDAARYVVLDHR